jgi:predicted ATPase
MSLAGGTQLGRYEIVGPLGRGGMGEVYRARDARLGRDVAVKVLPAHLTQHPERIDRFVREARAASSLNHPNIVTIHEIGDAPETGLFIVMELVKGRSLRELMAGPCAYGMLLQTGRQMAGALAVAHEAGIVHRDVKPENVMVRDDDYVKVLDFGLARLVSTRAEDSESETTPGTELGAVLGTTRYMSPEQARGEMVTTASDVFSLGIVLYELATGQHPFFALSDLDVRHAIIAEPALPPASLKTDLSATLSSLILQMLEKAPSLRPPAREVETILAAMASGRSGQEEEPAQGPMSRHMVGREREAAELRSGFASAVQGHGVVLCVAGEPGIGKTTLVEVFLQDLTSERPPCYLARGRCSERLAGTEAYLPFLEALENLLRGPNGESVGRLMKLLAPNWYALVLPTGTSESSSDRLSDAKASSQERLKRELDAFFKELCRVRPLVLFLDDLHWADASTVDLIAYLATRFASMRIVLVTTYRPADLLLAKHPFAALKLELQARGLCREIGLGFLSRADIERYFSVEFPAHRFPHDFAALIHTKTEGSPLFMVDVIRDLRLRRVISEEHGHWTLGEGLSAIDRELPESVRSMIQRRIDQLADEDRRLLSAASVQGYEFDSAVVAKTLEREAGEMEERLDVLDRVHGFVTRVAEREFPNRTLTVRYRFVHVLYQNALYGSLMPTRRASLSRAAAEALLGYYSDQSGTIANELAALFEAGRDFGSAVDYLLVATQNAARLFANHEAVALAHRALGLLKNVQNGDGHARQELALQVTLGPALIATQGWAAPGVEETYVRARALCERLEDSAQLSHVLYGLGLFHFMRANFEMSHRMGEELFALARRKHDGGLAEPAYHLLGLTEGASGEFETASEHLEQSIASYDSRQHRSTAIYDATVTGVGQRSWSGWNLTVLGYPESGLRKGEEAVARAQLAADPFSIAFAVNHVAWIHQLRRDAQAALEHAETVIEISKEHGFPFYTAFGMALRGWALTQQGQTLAEGVSFIRQGLAGWRATGTETFTTWFLAVYAEASAKLGQDVEALAVLDEALVFAKNRGERYYESELYRLRGERVLAGNTGSATSEAENWFRLAIETARRQHARWFELRAVTSLSRFLQRTGRQGETQPKLAAICGWFTEGFDTPDLKDARALLAAS